MAFWALRLPAEFPHGGVAFCLLNMALLYMAAADNTLQNNATVYKTSGDQRPYSSTTYEY